MHTQSALLALGVRPDTLSDEEKFKLDHDGFVVLYDMLSPAQVAAMREAMSAQFEREQTGQPGGPEEGLNMQDQSPAFDPCVSHPRLLAAIAHVLKENFKSQGVRSRPNPPGKGQQIMHADCGGPPPRPGRYFSCNSLWPFIDFTELNGATRVVPGSHLCGKHCHEEMPDLCAPHPRQVNLIIPAGSVAIFNGHLWHSATLNRSTVDRPNVTSFWKRNDNPDEPYVNNPLGEAAARRLGPAVASLFN